MPTADYTCPRCRHRFQRTVLRGEEDEPAPCPQCRQPRVKPSRGPASLFGGIAPFSRLNEDTN
jgi:putative FmdB family regulatory protein